MSERPAGRERCASSVLCERTDARTYCVLTPNVFIGVQRAMFNMRLFLFNYFTEDDGNEVKEEIARETGVI